MMPVKIRRQMTFLPDSARVIIRPFLSADVAQVVNIVNRALALTSSVRGHMLQWDC
jgi:hypothetical protein